MTPHEVTLGGCTPQPLMCYLKALGVLRLVAEQKDPHAQGCWRDGVFVLRSVLENDDLSRFLTNEYRPTSLVVPWSGADFFGVDRHGDAGPFKSTPTASKIIGAFLATTSERLSGYRQAIQTALAGLDACGVDSKPKLEDKKLKARFIAWLRSTLDDMTISWVDACTVLSESKATFSALLGSGGGSDGNTHFSDNFMQNLWEVLPDFDSQKKSPAGSSRALLESALWATPTSKLVPKRTSALFDGGAVGGANAGQGFERVSLGNPWSIILCLEGTIALAGSASRRYGVENAGRAAFPFQVRLTPTRLDSAADKESAGREIWLPLWSSWSNHSEVVSLFSEGRASTGHSRAERGVDFARAVTSLGVDRGIDAFARYAVVKGRVGGDNYNTSTMLGRFEVNPRQTVDLLREIDPWLESFRRAVNGDNVPPRFGRALREIESSIFEFCQFGGTARFAEILCALGGAEGELATGEKFREDNKYLRPLGGLSPEWVGAANDDSAEFELAMALAGIWDPEGKIGSIRTNLEPVSPHGRTWAEATRSVVWGGSDLARNLVAVLQRRTMDAGRGGCRLLPLASHRSASLDAVSRFIAGETNDEKIELLLRGLVLIEHAAPVPQPEHWRNGDIMPLPRAYALLKLLFLPHAVAPGHEDAVMVKPEPTALALLGAGRIGDACKLAARRLRSTGLVPMPHRSGRRVTREEDWRDAGATVDPKRIAAALLIPIGLAGVHSLAGTVLATSPDSATAV